jgi:putative hydrolase
MQSVDPNNPESLQQALSGGMFEPQDTPEQQVTLRRLETLLALIEGWVDAVVTDATKDRLPSAAALRETLQRRRATGGPAEQTFSTLVGLELRPRRLREASQLWAAVTEARGRSGRDALWATPIYCRPPTTSTTRAASPGTPYSVRASSPSRPSSRPARRRRRNRPPRRPTPTATSRPSTP